MKKKLLAIILAVVAVACCVVTTVVYVKKNRTENDDAKANVQTETAVDKVTDEIGEVLDDEVNALPTRMTFRQARILTGSNDYASVTVQATVKPDNATNKNVTWSIAFVNAASAWATGKTVTDYVTVTPQSESSNIATVECLQPFGEQIKITATSQSNASAKAECTIDFAKRIFTAPLQVDSQEHDDYHVVGDFSDEGLYLDINLDWLLWWDEPHSEYTDYTVDDEFLSEFELVANAETISELNADTGLSVTAGVLEEDTSMDIIYDTLLNSLNGVDWTDTDNYNKLNEWLMANTDKSLFTIKYKATGLYSVYEAEVPIYLNAQALTVLVSSITLNQSNIVI